MSGALLAASCTGYSGLDVQSITCGKTGAIGGRTVGFLSGGVLGSMTDATSNIYSGAAIQTLVWDENTATIVLQIAGVQSNSGWTSMQRIGSGQVYNRASATFSTVGGVSKWTWTALSTFPLGGDGVTSTVIFQ